MTGLTPAVLAALPVAQAAAASPTSPHGPVDTVVFALDGAGLLVNPSTDTDVPDAVEALARLHPQVCPAGQHRLWFADADGPLPCPWCRIDQLEAAADRMPAGCKVSGCGSTGGYLDTNTQRTDGWVRVHVKGTPMEAARWYCTTRCASVAHAGPADPVYLAVSGELLLGAYTARDAAAGHCETALRRHAPDAMTTWVADSEDPTVTVLSTEHRGHTSASWYRVVALVPRPAYDPTGGA